MLSNFKDLGFLLCFSFSIINYSLAFNFQDQDNTLDESVIPLDQIENKLEELRQIFDRSEIDSALILGDQILNSTKFHQKPKLELHANYQLARIYHRENNYHKSDSLLLSSLSRSKDNDLSFDISILLYNNDMRQGEFDDGKLILDQTKQFIEDSVGVNMVRYRYSLADYYSNAVNDNKVVLDLLLMAKRDAPTETDFKVLFNLNYQLGALYNSIGVYDQAILVGEENENAAIEEGNYYYQLFGIFTQLASYVELRDHEKIHELVERSIRIKEEQHVSTAHDYLLFSQGKSYLQQEMYDSAFHYFDRGEKIGLERNSKLDLSRNWLGKSQVYFNEGEYGLAKKYVDKANELNPAELKGLDEMYWRLEAVNGNYRSAYNKVAKSFEELIEDEYANDNYEILSKLLSEKFNAEKDQQQLELKEKEKKNKLFVVLWLTAGLVFFLLLTAINQIRNRKKLEKLNNSLMKRNEALTNFSYISSHDLKEPVRNIVSFSELLEQKLSKSPDQAQELEFATIIKHSSNTLLEIVRSLKIFSETAFDEDIQLDVFNVEDVFDDLKRNMHQLITTKNAQFRFVNLQNVAEVTFSKPMLYLLLQNLIQNALKYNVSDNPNVKVDISVVKDSYLFKIVDNGKGIDPKKLEYIFKPFKTLQSKSLSQSSGLGLSICKNILDRFGGEIWVESEVSKGSTFYFTIPKTIDNV